MKDPRSEIQDVGGAGTLRLMGAGASPGVVIGPAYLLERRSPRTPRYNLPAEKIPEEIERLRAAIQISDQQLNEIRSRAEAQEQTDGGGSTAGGLGGAKEYLPILDAHRAMLQDPVFLQDMEQVVREERVNAEWAIRRVVRRIKGVLGAIGDEYFRERRADVDFLGDRLVKNLLGQAPDFTESPLEECILIVRDLSPADAAVMLRRGTVLGLVTDLGGRTGHTALVARSREIPAVVGTVDASKRIARGDLVAIDGTSGLVVVRPSKAQLKELRRGREQYLTREVELMADRDLPAVTLDGVRVRLLGNIEFPEEVPSLLSHGGEGVGLHRTEFLYLHHRKTPPTEEDHLASYREILTLAAPHPVTIRTFDLGGDKVAGVARQRETNPALGLRAIRFTLRAPELFRTQLRALLRASSAGNLRIMFPMISSLGELREAKAQLDIAREELLKAGEPIPADIPVGIMVELPSAAGIADRLATVCDFFSVGTNDLIQYSMAIDRQNPLVAYLYRPLHLAILRTLEYVAKAAHDAGIPVAMCGEMAGDPFYAAILVGLGFDELSMSATSIPLVKRVIRALRADDARAMLKEVMTHTLAEDLEEMVRAWMSERFGNLMERG